MVKRKKNEEAQDVAPEIKDELFCDDVFLTKEQLLEIRCSHLERDNIQKEEKILFAEIQLIERHKELMNLKLNDVKAKSVVKSREHKELINEIGRRVGINLNNSLINFETGKVTFS